MNETSEPKPIDANQLAQERTDLALQRTLIAADRTLMAWIRTSISMIGFGFTIYKFFQYLREAEGIHEAARVHAPRNLGLALIALGILALLGAIFQHWQFLKTIGVTGKAYTWSLSVVVALLMILVGALAFVGVQLRTGPF